ncbi:hypothetical protein MSP8887_01177 [Marinomonas spartinae]|uniref:Uncharacterized protein n=1 Tax=Marinomonas spartinae TaxID=1792290 RepID=A0A1A8T875_9GAMM|nr:hypothetical protein [Marinomonas spartinae]SBS27485.1 hypothetical protein MSP8886_00864 [Marinomonas spartinae]SBS29864.1 hypothetical protein MSP8887_01177 [Marinomonas spartinae]
MQIKANENYTTIFDDSLIYKSFKKGQKIEKIKHQGQSVWVKSPEATHSRLFHRLIARVTKLTLLMPVQSKTPQESLVFESTKLQTLASLGLPVATVLEQTEHFLYLSDTGTDLRRYLKKTALSQAERTDIILKALNVLASIHNAGHYHAGAQIKNYTIDQQGVVSAIDFEESFAEHQALLDIQYRDVFLFLMSISPYSDHETFQHVIDSYLSITGKHEIKKKLQYVADRARPLMKILAWLDKHNKKLSRDIASTYSLLLFLTTL